VFNETHFDDPEFNALFLEARVEPDATKRGVIIRDMQKILFDRGGYLIPFFPNTVDAYRTNVAGIGLDMTGVGLGKGRWATVYFV
jgi:peptide/nickel transport system substrate-binding protein